MSRSNAFYWKMCCDWWLNPVITLQKQGIELSLSLNGAATLMAQQFVRLSTLIISLICVWKHLKHALQLPTATKVQACFFVFNYFLQKTFNWISFFLSSLHLTQLARHPFSFFCKHHFKCIQMLSKNIFYTFSYYCRLMNIKF